LKIKELIAQLSTFDQEVDVELMYLYRTTDADGNDTIIRLTEKSFSVVPHVGDLKSMSVSSVLLATSSSLAGE
jgi:hypothetical protein